LTTDVNIPFVFPVADDATGSQVLDAVTEGLLHRVSELVAMVADVKVHEGVNLPSKTVNMDYRSTKKTEGI
jgi:hypothetical protein